MPVGGAHQVMSIDQKLASLASTPIDQECCVFKVHHRLRQINVEAYEPGLLAIGPYHHGKDRLSFMEKHKLRFLHRMLKRTDENSAKRYITAMRKKEERVRNFYADQFPELSSNEFVEMMLLDGCFIIELFRIQSDAILKGSRLDTIFNVSWIYNGIMRDLLLFENQLPFFILTELFEMSEGCNQQDHDDAHCESTTSTNNIEKNQILVGNRSEESSKHVIDFSRKHEITLDESSVVNDHVSERVSTRLLDCALSFFYFAVELNVSLSSCVSTTNIRHLLGLIHTAMSPSPKDQVGTNDWTSIAPNIIALQEAGVEFKKVERSNLFHIKYNNGVMEIPVLNIVGNTESAFRNLIAYEQYSQDIRLKYVTDFATLMDYLINTPKDVELLRRKGIIKNWMGDDEVVANMFNKLSRYVHFGSDFYYADIIEEVNNHCDKHWNVWKAKLRRDYFNSPWALLSVLAAVLLLLLAIAQTVFSTLSYVFK